MRNDPETTACPQCGAPFTPTGRQRFCSNACRQAAWRRRHQPAATSQPDPGRRARVVYQCPGCDQRLIDTQRCDDCNTFCTKLGPGGPCPHCAEPLTTHELTGQA